MRTILTVGVAVLFAACGENTNMNQNQAVAVSTAVDVPGSTVFIPGGAQAIPVVMDQTTNTASVTIMNTTSTEHSMVTDDGSINTGPIRIGESVTVTVNTSGDIHYHCGIHPQETGVIRVSNSTTKTKSSPSPSPSFTDVDPRAFV